MLFTRTGNSLRAIASRLRVVFGACNMGSQVIAKCDCGVEGSVLIGGGMRDFMTTCFLPCLCENCCDVVQVNLISKKMRCPRCRALNPIPYDDARLSESPGHYHVAEWNMKDRLGRKLVLTDGKHRCPKCGKMSLEFSDGGLCWD